MYESIIQILAKTKKLYFFGTGQGAEMFYGCYELARELGIVPSASAFLDNSIAKIGGVLYGLPVLDPAEQSWLSDESTVWITLINEPGISQIKSQLEELGFKGDIIWLPHRECLSFLCYYARSTGVSDETFAKLIDGMAQRRYPGIREPRLLSDKIHWYMVYDRDPIKTRLADKLLVRDYVAEKIGAQYVKPLVGGPWSSFDEVPLEELKPPYALKCNHGCAMNWIVRNAEDVKPAEMKADFDRWMATNFAYKNLEMQYEGIEPQIYAEEYFAQPDGAIDYSLEYHFYNGHCGQFRALMDVCSGVKGVSPRLITEMKGTKRLDDPELDHRYASDELARSFLESGLREKFFPQAQALAEGFNMVRVDFHVVGDCCTFSELTFSPASGNLYYLADDVQLKLAKQWQLPV